MAESGDCPHPRSTGVSPKAAHVRPTPRVNLAPIRPPFGRLRPRALTQRAPAQSKECSDSGAMWRKRIIRVKLRFRSMAAKNLIGPIIRRARCAGGLSQQALAARCNLLGWGVSRATLSKIESRLRRVNDAELWMLAAALGAEIAELFPSASRRRPPAAFVAVARHSED